MRSLHHPWTLGLATGKTSRASFTQYVAQDAYFLRAFAKAYAYALTKADDEESVRAFHSLIGAVLEELSLHSSYAVKWGVDLKNVSEHHLLVPSRRLVVRMLGVYCTTLTHWCSLFVPVQYLRQNLFYCSVQFLF